MAAEGSLADAVPAPRQPGHQPGHQAAAAAAAPEATPGPGGAQDQPGQAGEAPGGVADGNSPGAAPGGSLLDRLDPQQRAAAAAPAPLMIIAGPGTGKTRTLTHRLAAAVAEQGVPAEACLALTFTRRAAGEMRERLAALLGRRAGRLTVTTFHGLGLMILRECHELAGLTADFAVADEKTALEVAAELAGSSRSGRALLADAAADPQARDVLRRGLAARDLVDFDGLVELAVEVLDAGPAVAARLRARWPRISVDEYQDIDAAQYALLRLLAGDGTGLTVIGDPDQAIIPVPRCGRGLLPALRAGLPGRGDGGALGQLPLRPGHRRRGPAGHRPRHPGARPGTAGGPGRRSQHQDQVSRGRRPGWRGGLDR